MVPNYFRLVPTLFFVRVGACMIGFDWSRFFRATHSAGGQLDHSLRMHVAFLTLVKFWPCTRVVNGMREMTFTWCATN